MGRPPMRQSPSVRRSAWCRRNPRGAFSHAVAGAPGIAATNASARKAVAPAVVRHKRLPTTDINLCLEVARSAGSIDRSQLFEVVDVAPAAIWSTEASSPKVRIWVQSDFARHLAPKCVLSARIRANIDVLGAAQADLDEHGQSQRLHRWCVQGPMDAWTHGRMSHGRMSEVGTSGVGAGRTKCP